MGDRRHMHSALALPTPDFSFHAGAQRDINNGILRLYAANNRTPGHEHQLRSIHNPAKRRPTAFKKSDDQFDHDSSTDNAKCMLE